MPSHRLSVSRAALALLWAAALVVAVRGDVPGTNSELPFAAALLLATYPLIDVVSSLLGGSRLGAAISAAAAVGVGVAAFGADAGATLVAFGAWAAVSGALQLGVAVQRRRAAGGQAPMLVSGGLSTLAGVSFLDASRKDDANLAALAGYMALGAVLFLVSARRERVAVA